MSVPPPRLVSMGRPRTQTCVPNQVRRLLHRATFTRGLSATSCVAACGGSLSLGFTTPWIGHIPFAFWLTEAVQPKIFVKLLSFWFIAPSPQANPKIGFLQSWPSDRAFFEPLDV